MFEDIIRRIRDRVRQNDNLLEVRVIGDRSEGKTYATMKLNSELEKLGFPRDRVEVFDIPKVIGKQEEVKKMVKGGFGGVRIKVDQKLSAVFGVPEGTLIKTSEMIKLLWVYIRAKNLYCKIEKTPVECAEVTA
jgi:hypothetical protein